MLRSVLLLLVSVPGIVLAQEVYVQGNVQDDKGQLLPGAHIVVYPDSTITTTNSEGRYLFRTTPGAKRLQVTFVGFEIFNKTITVENDTTLPVTLYSKTSQLQEVVISGTRDTQQEIFDGNQTSKHILTKNDISAIPVLGGEADVIKTIQLLPGAVRGIEGSSDLFVRGGAADQNLVLLDDAPIYNTSHLFGFLSVFNVDVLDRVEAINGGFPAEYGGRLSSVLNVNTKSSIPEKTTLSGDIGLIASRLFIDQPIVKDKASFWLAYRRTYIDQVIRATGEELPYYFYDFNGKLLLKPTSRDEIQISHYSGEDILDLFRDNNNDGDGFLTTYASGNSTQTLRWNRVLKRDWYSTLALTRTKFRYQIRNAFEENELLAISDIEDLGARILFQKDSVGSGVVRTGLDWTRHQVSPNVINTVGTISELLKSSSSRGRIADEFAAHFLLIISTFIF